MDHKKNVLIVDDEPNIVNLVRLSLNQEKYNIYEAFSSRDAMTIVKTQLPDIVVLDLMMPGVNGYEFCQALRENPRTKNVPVLILSAKSQMDDKLHAIDVGADDYVTKPFDPMELVRRIKLNMNMMN
ncbi:response regulator [Candidatus Woesearchaeota archaeon]|nr:response regulator [Candidatus Woesearchaeota archaeon]